MLGLLPVILIIGDSLSCGSLGRHLFDNLTAQGKKVTLYCAISSTPAHWLNGQAPAGQICQTRAPGDSALKPCGEMPTFSEVLKSVHPDQVIVELGTNSLFEPPDPSYIAPDDPYVVMAKEVGAYPCDWIGPPELRPDQSQGFEPGRVQTEEDHLAEFYPWLSRRVSGSCRLIDSRPWTGKGSPGGETIDGVHRTDAAGAYWATEIEPKL